MGYTESFVGAMVTTFMILTVAQILLSFVTPEPKNHAPTLLIGGGFILGHYAPGVLKNDPDMALAMVKFAGSAICLVNFWFGLRYRATLVNAA